MVGARVICNRKRLDRTERSRSTDVDLPLKGSGRSKGCTTVTAGKCNWRHSGWSVRLVGFPQYYPACRFLTNKILSCSCVGGVSE